MKETEEGGSRKGDGGPSEPKRRSTRPPCKEKLDLLKEKGILTKSHLHIPKLKECRDREHRKRGKNARWQGSGNSNSTRAHLRERRRCDAAAGEGNLPLRPRRPINGERESKSRGSGQIPPRGKWHEERAVEHPTKTKINWDEAGGGTKVHPL